MNASFFHFINIETLIREEEWFDEIFDCFHEFRASIIDFIIKLCHVNWSHRKSWLSIYFFDFVRMWLVCHIIVYDALCSFRSIFHFDHVVCIVKLNHDFFHFDHTVKCSSIASLTIYVNKYDFIFRIMFSWINVIYIRFVYMNRFTNMRDWWAQVLFFRIRELFNSSWRKCSNSWSFTISNRIDWIMRVSFSFLLFFDYRSWRLNEINRFMIKIHQFTSSLINERRASNDSFFSFFAFHSSFEVSWKSKFINVWIFNKKSFIFDLVSNVSWFEINWNRSTNNTFYI
jgi:hypothetical protein